SFSRPRRLVTTRPASSSRRRCFMTPKRVIVRRRSSAPSVCPSRLNSASSKLRRVGSASALNTASIHPIICDHLVTCKREKGLTPYSCRIPKRGLTPFCLSGRLERNNERQRVSGRGARSRAYRLRRFVAARNPFVVVHEYDSRAAAGHHRCFDHGH